MFSDNVTWLLRLCDEYADEKVAMEVEVLSHPREDQYLIIPIPTIHTWGLAADTRSALDRSFYGTDLFRAQAPTAFLKFLSTHE